MEDLIKITVIDREGEVHELEAPTDMGMNVMELCKSYDLPVLGTCGTIRHPLKEMTMNKQC